MKYHEMTKNYIFREFECGLTKEQAAELCFKSVRTITEWDRGKPIPPECKRLMRLFTKRNLSYSCQWDGFKMRYDKMEIPTGQLVSPQEILTGLALNQIDSVIEIEAKRVLLKYARAMMNLRK
ncbi:regulator [Vibrio fluvialis]